MHTWAAYSVLPYRIRRCSKRIVLTSRSWNLTPVRRISQPTSDAASTEQHEQHCLAKLRPTPGGHAIPTQKYAKVKMTYVWLCCRKPMVTRPLVSCSEWILPLNRRPPRPAAGGRMWSSLSKANSVSGVLALCRANVLQSKKCDRRYQYQQ